MANELEDFEAFIAPEFSPVQFSNTLLLLTNSNSDASLDLTTPSKRLGFDLAEVEKRMGKLILGKYEVLYKELTTIEQVKDSAEVLQPSLQDLNNSFKRLDQDLLKPYQESLELHDALKKIHTTSTLLRSVQFYLYLVQNLEDSFNLANANVLDANNVKNLVKVTKNLHQLRQYKEKNVLMLKSLKLIKEYEHVLTNREFKIQQLLTDYFSRLPTLNDHNVNQLVVLLANFGGDQYLEKKVAEFVGSQVSICTNNLVKTLTNPKTFAQVMYEVLEQHLRPIAVVQSSVMKNKLHLSKGNLVSIFYRDLLTYFESNLKKTYSKGGPVSKNLKSYYPVFEEAIKEGLVKGDVQGLVKKDGLEVRMMMNSISVLSR